MHFFIRQRFVFGFEENFYCHLITLFIISKSFTVNLHGHISYINYLHILEHNLILTLYS